MLLFGAQDAADTQYGALAPGGEAEAERAGDARELARHRANPPMARITPCPPHRNFPRPRPLSRTAYYSTVK